jgi:DNA (cytosine-5)-methyltransferase 1
MKHVSLFSGIGGLDLAAEWVGFETVLQVEQNPYCLKVLEKHWPDVPRITDIREVHADERWTKPTVVSGGFPCQPFSAAGKRGGQDDDRYLWPEMLRVIRELSPTYVVAENVSGLLSLNDGAEFELVLSDLERAGYEVLPFHYPAASVGAPHRRDRVFIVAHASSERVRDKSESITRRGGAAITVDNGTDGNVADTEGIRWRQGYSHAGGGASRVRAMGSEKRMRSTNGCWWEAEPSVCRVAPGISHRVDRLRALGNAVVPAQAYPIFATIAAMEQA